MKIDNFKFLQKLNDYNIHINDVPMFKVYTYKNINQEIIDQLNEAARNYIFERNTEENRNELMEELLKHFIKIESIYVEPV